MTMFRDTGKSLQRCIEKNLKLLINVRVLSRIRSCESVTLLYASKEPVYNHARILQAFLEERLKK